MSLAAAEACIEIGNVVRFLRDEELIGGSWANNSAVIRAREEDTAEDMELDTAIEKVKVHESAVVVFAVARAALGVIAERLSVAAAVVTVSTAGLLQVAVSPASAPSHRSDTAFSTGLVSLVPSRLLVEGNAKSAIVELFVCWRIDLNLACDRGCLNRRGTIR